MINREIKLPESHSFFLFGGRGVGKSTLLESRFNSQNATLIDLLEPDTEQELFAHPEHLKLILDKVKKDHPQKKWVFIDEVQKIPTLLNVVHSLIEKKHFNFALTGSSSRKLKRGGSNLLAGRAFVFYLYPLTHRELGEQFDLNTYLTWGGLPKIFELTENLEKKRYLKSYALTYLKEEIVAEQLVRNLNPFRSFLEVAAQSSGKIVSFSKISRDVHAEVPTVQSYFDILEDTMVGFLLKSHHESYRKRQRHNPKFYYFDPGIQRTLAKRLDLPLLESTYEYGDLFEGFVIQEIFRQIKYQELDWELSYLRTKDNFEIDLIIERPGLSTLFIEIKSTDKVDDRDFTSFKSFLSSLRIKPLKNIEAFVFSRDRRAFIMDQIQFLPWNQGLREIGL